MQKILMIVLAIWSLNSYAAPKALTAEQLSVGFEATLTKYQKKRLYRSMLIFDAKFDQLAALEPQRRVAAEIRLREDLADELRMILSKEQLALYKREVAQ